MCVSSKITFWVFSLLHIQNIIEIVLNGVPLSTVLLMELKKALDSTIVQLVEASWSMKTACLMSKWTNKEKIDISTFQTFHEIANYIDLVSTTFRTTKFWTLINWFLLEFFLKFYYIYSFNFNLIIWALQWYLWNNMPLWNRYIWFYEMNNNLWRLQITML